MRSSILKLDASRAGNLLFGRGLEAPPRVLDRCREGGFAANRGSICWARLLHACAAGSGVLATAALTAAVVVLLFAGALADTANAGIFSNATSRLFGRSKSLDLAPIVGAPANVAQELAQALVAAGKDSKLTITPNGTGVAPTRCAAICSPRARKGRPRSPISGHRRLQGGARRPRLRASSSSRAARARDPWSGVDSAAISSLAAKIASQIAASLSGGRAHRPGRLRPAARPGTAPSAGRQAAGGNRRGPCPPRGQGSGDRHGLAGLRRARRRA